MVPAVSAACGDAASAVLVASAAVFFLAAVVSVRAVAITCSLPALKGLRPAGAAAPAAVPPNDRKADPSCAAARRFALSCRPPQVPPEAAAGRSRSWTPRQPPTPGRYHSA